MRIKGKFERSGYFWLPNNEAEKIPGTLKISDGGTIELEVFDLLDKSVEALNSNKPISRIIGQVEDDGYVTLENNVYTKQNIGFDNISKSIIRCSKCLSGVRFNKNEEVLINNLSFKVEGLDEWVDVCGIDVKTSKDFSTSTISYNPPSNIQLGEYDNFKIEIGFLYSLPFVGDIKESKISQKAYLKLSSQEPRRLSDFTKIAYRLVNLLCFATEETLTLYDLIAYSDLIRYKEKDYDNGQPRRVPIKIYYPSLPFSNESPEPKPHKMLFNLKDLGSSPNIAVFKWLTLYEKFSPVVSLFLSSQSGIHRFLDGKFISLVQGLETYHRRSENITVMNEEEYMQLCDTLLEACPVDQKDWLLQRLRFANEINLRARIKALISPFKEYFGSSKKRERLVTKIVDTRNYLTHYSEELEAKSAHSNELYTLCLYIELIIQMHLMSEIGFSLDEVQKIVDGNYSLKQILQREI